MHSGSRRLYAMRRIALSLLVAACACGGPNDPSSHARAICDAIYDRTQTCLADIGCQGALSRGVYVDQCLGDGLSDADRDAFVASSCDAVNAGSCLAEASFYRSNCDCRRFTDCPAGTQCTAQVTDDALCLSGGGVPSGSPACDDGNLCPAGMVCAVPNGSTTAGRCVQFCVP